MVFWRVSWALEFYRSSLFVLEQYLRLIGIQYMLDGAIAVSGRRYPGRSNHTHTILDGSLSIEHHYERSPE